MTLKLSLSTLEETKKLKLNQLLKVSHFYSNFLSLEIVIKTKDNTTKFKLRCPRYLYTAYVEDTNKANKIKSAIPSNIQKVELGGKKKNDKKATGKKASKQ